MEVYAPGMRAAILKLREDLRLLDNRGLPEQSSSIIHNATSPTTETRILKRGGTDLVNNETVLASPTNNKTLLIVLGSVGSAFIIFLVILFVCCYIRRRKKIKFEFSKDDLLSDYFAHGDKSRSLNSVHSTSKDDGDSNVLDFILPQPPPKRKGFARKSISGRLNPELYEQGAQQGSSKTVGFNDGAGLGTLEFSVVMEQETANLIVAILRVCSLPERVLDDNRTAMRNPFVRVQLLPDQLTHQTKVKRGTLNPLFNECVVFKVDPFEIPHKRLHISVYDHDKKNIRHSLGHVLIPLESIDLEEEVFYRLFLEHLEQVLHAHLGDMEIALTYIPDTGKIKVGVLNCKDFNEFSKDMEQAMKCQVFIRVQMFRGRRLDKSKETSAVQLGPDIFFNEYLNFSMPLRNVDETHFLFTAVLKAGSSDHGVPVGRVELGPYLYARGEELMHWQQAIDNPRKTITMFHMIESPEVSGRGHNL